MKRICVFCGSRAGSDPAYRQTAESLGRLLATKEIGLVYGGGLRGLMGVLADATLADDGEVIGIIPEDLFLAEHIHPGLTELRSTPNLLARKALMAELSDAFIALPGGIGTLDELFEMWTWRQLGVHPKPCGVVNAGGFYDGLLSFLDGMVEREFLSQSHRDALIVRDTPEAMLKALAAG